MILASTNHKRSVKGFNSLEDAIYYNDPLASQLQEHKHQLPAFPNWLNKKYKCKGEEVNLFTLKCTCEEFIDSEIYFAGRDIRKICGHIYYCIRRFAEGYLDELTDKLLSEQIKYGKQKFYKLKEDTLIGTQPGNEWIKIYLLKDGKWKTYGYNIKEKRFSYNRIPPITVEEITALYDAK